MVVKAEPTLVQLGILLFRQEEPVNQFFSVQFPVALPDCSPFSDADQRCAP